MDTTMDTTTVGTQQLEAGADTVSGVKLEQEKQTKNNHEQ